MYIFVVHEGLISTIRSVLSDSVLIRSCIYIYIYQFGHILYICIQATMI